LCDRFGFIVPLQSHVPYVYRLMDSYRMGHFVAGIKAVDVYEQDMSKQHRTIIERAINLAREIIAQGAQAIIPLGGLLFPYEVDPKELEAEIGVPVINTKAVAIRFAELMVSGKMLHSQKAYPYAPGLTPDAVSRRSAS
jgi:Asp/Glu/hydantoin racemase